MLKTCEIESLCETHESLFKTQWDLRCMPAHVLLEDNYFTTVPTLVVRPMSGQKSAVEEDLYASFEEAISERVAVVSRQLSNLSRAESRADLPTLQSGPGQSRTRLFSSASLARVGHFWQARRRALALLCLGLNLLLLGFDCMGLLVLTR